MLPVCGTVLVLFAARSKSFWTGSRLAQWLGSDSYSIYLWHWPVIVAIAYCNLLKNVAALAAGLVLTLVLGHLSYLLVESRLRSALGRLPRRRQSRVVAGATMVVVVASLALLWLSPGLHREDPTDPVVRDSTMPSSLNGWCFRNVEDHAELPLDDRVKPCLLGDKRAPAASGLLIGDSFAAQYEPFWDRIGQDAGVELESVTTNWCFPSTTSEYLGSAVGRGHAQCMIDREYLRKRVNAYDFIVYAGLWRLVFLEGLQQGLFDAIAEAAAKTRIVVVMAAPTEFDTNVSTQYRRRKAIGMPFDIRRFPKVMDDDTRAANAKVEAYTQTFNNVLFVERNALFNIAGVPSDVTPDNIPFSLDGSHISVYGAKQAAAAFLRTSQYAEIRSLLTDPATPHHDGPSSTIVDSVHDADRPPR